MTVFIQATVAGSDIGPFNLYSDVTVPPYSGAFETGISKAALEAGFISYSVPPGTTSIKVKSVGKACTNEQIISIEMGGIIIKNDDVLFETIDDVVPAFYVLTDYYFPVVSGKTFYGHHAGFSGDIDVHVSSNAVEGHVRLYVNSVLIGCQTAFAIGPQVLNFPGVNINPTDLVEIEYSTTPC